jgi:hypothetical protein
MQKYVSNKPGDSFKGKWSIELIYITIFL